MDKARLEEIAAQMMTPGKGILAADESTGTIKKRFDQINTESTEDSRRDYREMLFRADGFDEAISGVILFDETIRQNAADGTALRDLIASKGAVPGIKVDAGAKDLPGCPGEQVTEGLDGLRDRLAEYRELGAGFAKWRAVINIADGIPSYSCIRANTHALARYAALCQEAGIVPIVEPEVIMDGSHSIDVCDDVTGWALSELYQELYNQRVYLEGTVLKPNMVISGTDAPTRAGVEEVAARTVATLKRHVPSAVAGIAFLSGGQSDEEATAHLNAMNAGYDLPWGLTFSYGRALQQAALKAWQGQTENVAAAQAAFAHRARMNGLAAAGEWSEATEQAGQAAA
ncbi:MAG: class I fructose-bisphosphate aldolase [Alphaproteobacteria bacterium]